MKKFFNILLIIIVVGLIFSQASAISNWTQTIFTQNGKSHWGIWSTKKPNTQSIPDVIVTEDGRLGVGLRESNTISNGSGSFREGDVIARRFCIENTRQCVDSFAPDPGSNYKFIILKSNLFFQDENFTQKYTDISKP